MHGKQIRAISLIILDRVYKNENGCGDPIEIIMSV